MKFAARSVSALLGTTAYLAMAAVPAMAQDQESQDSDEVQETVDDDLTDDPVIVQTRDILQTAFDLFYQ